MYKSMWVALLTGLTVALVLLTGCTSPKSDKVPAKTDQRQQAPAAPACTVTVPAGQSIQQAINRASVGAIICVAAGIYTENLTISKSVTLQGAGQGQVTVMATALAMPVIRLVGNVDMRVEIKHLILMGKAGSWDADISVEGKAQAMLQDVQLSGRGIGLRAKDAAQVTVQNAQISHNSIGCIAEGAAQITLQDSQIVSNDGDGLSAIDSAQVSLKNTKISGNRNAGLSASDASHLTLSDSTVSDNGFTGLYAGSAKDKAEITLTNTKVTGNRYAGLLLRSSAHITLSGSSVSDNGSDGLFIEDEAQAHILNTTLSGNKGHGIQASIPSNLLECKGNTLSKNSQGDYNSAELAQKCK